MSGRLCSWNQMSFPEIPWPSFPLPMATMASLGPESGVRFWVQCARRSARCWGKFRNTCSKQRRNRPLIQIARQEQFRTLNTPCEVSGVKFSCWQQTGALQVGVVSKDSLVFTATVINSQKTCEASVQTRENHIVGFLL